MAGPLDKRSSADHTAIEMQLEHCARLLTTVEDFTGTWRQRGGRGFDDDAEVLLQTIFARSTRTYEAALHLGRHGFGEQVQMLNRSLFEDMVDAHWVSLNDDLGPQRLREHHRYSNQLKLDVAAGFPEYFGSQLPDLQPPMDEDERRSLVPLFGKYGHKSWTGVELHGRFAAIEHLWEDEAARRHAQFFHLWVHRENNETLHCSAHSLGNLGAPQLVGGNEMHFMTGSTEHLLTPALFCLFWTFTQTVWLVFELFGLDGLDELQAEVVNPGFAAFGSASNAPPA